MKDSIDHLDFSTDHALMCDVRDCEEPIVCRVHTPCCGDSRLYCEDDMMRFYYIFDKVGEANRDMPEQFEKIKCKCGATLRGATWRIWTRLDR